MQCFSLQGLKYPGLHWFSDEPGKMYVLDMLHPKPTPVELQIKGELDLSSFNPHGISVYTDEAGKEQIRCNISTTEQRKSVHGIITINSAGTQVMGQDVV